MATFDQVANMIVRCVCYLMPSFCTQSTTACPPNAASTAAASSPRLLPNLDCKGRWLPGSGTIGLPASHRYSSVDSATVVMLTALSGDGENGVEHV
jgi:hypothetical protein